MHILIFLKIKFFFDFSFYMWDEVPVDRCTRYVVVFIYLKICRKFKKVLFSFSLKTGNSDENIFGWIFKDIFSENGNRKHPKNENNKISFLVFSVENINFILVKIKM